LVRFEVEMPLVPGEGDGGEAKARYLTLDDIAISEKASILTIKKQLFEAWASLQAKIDAAGLTSNTLVPQSPNHIRLRDLKGGKVSGPLRDDRIVGRCLLGLADGRRVLVQTLANAEKIGPDDLMLTLRVASYDKKTLSGALDLCVPRACTVQQLYTRIASEHAYLCEPVSEETGDLQIPEARSMELAKGFTTGPSVSLKNALKLKWNDPSVLAAPSAAVDASPLSLRDGSVLVVRGRADWLRAQARVKAKREDMANQPVAAGAGTSAVRARTSQGRRLRQSNTEPALKIETRPPLPDGIGSLTGSDLPQPSPTRN
jgi:hypothetical protein